MENTTTATTSVVLPLRTLALILFQCSTFPIFLRFADYRTRTSHQIMLAIGVQDTLQVGTYFFTSLSVALGLKMPHQAEKFFGACNMLSFQAMVLEHFVLALNRSYTIFRSKFRVQLNESQLERKVFGVLNCANCVWPLLALFQTPLLGATIDYTSISFAYEMALPYSQTYAQIANPTALVVPGCSFCLYLSIIFILNKNKTKKTSGEQQAAQNAREMRVLAQALVLFAGMLAEEFGWIFGAFFLNVLESQLLTLCFYQPYSGLSPLLYLTMNSDFRRRYLRFYRLKKETKTASKQKIIAVKMNNLVKNVR